MIPRHALLVIGSVTPEDSFGVTSGLRVRDALKGRGWTIETVHAADAGSICSLIQRPEFDLVIPVGFGAPCEDGRIHALAELFGVPCAGPSASAGALMQDKAGFQRLVESVFDRDPHVRTPRTSVIVRGMIAEDALAAVDKLTSPFVIKPNFSGSSAGLYVTSDASDAAQSALRLCADEGKVLVQELERDIAHEVSCTVLDTASGPILLPIVELRRDGVQVLGQEEKFGDRALNRHVVPDRLHTSMRERISRAVMRLRDAIGPAGLTRYDILVSRDSLVFLEVNGIAGLLESSIACDAARAHGMSFDDLALGYAETAFIERREPRVRSTLGSALCI